MPRPHPPLAKLTRPQLHGAVARERLYAILDDAKTRSTGVYISGPPGSGKSTVVSTWLQARRILGIWYQVDQGDADLATFFDYLVRASAAFQKKG